MAELNRTMAALLDAVTLVGSKWVPQGDEGPRMVGHCAFCKRQCRGASVDCETRVFKESVSSQNRCPDCHMAGGRHHVKCESPRK